MEDFKFRYTIYIKGTAENVWSAITNPELTHKYWGHNNVSDWEVGSKWEHQRGDETHIVDVVGIVTISSRPNRLSFTWTSPDEALSVSPSRVTIKIDSHHDIVRITIDHDNLANNAELVAVTKGWAAVLSNLKSFIETGRALPQNPWDMPE